MKHRVSFVLFCLFAFRPAAWACEICEAQQPKILRGLTHGGGPQGSFDYIIVLATVAVVLVALGYSIKFIARPGEREPSHIKRIVLQEDYHGA
jgi:hypothetical protein